MGAGVKTVTSKVTFQGTDTHLKITCALFKVSQPCHILSCCDPYYQLVQRPLFKRANCSFRVWGCCEGHKGHGNPGCHISRWLLGECSKAAHLLGGSPHLATSTTARCSSDKCQSLGLLLTQTRQFHSFPGMEISKITPCLWYSPIFTRQYLLPLWLHPLAIQTQLPFGKQHVQENHTSGGSNPTNDGGWEQWMTECYGSLSWGWGTWTRGRKA